MTPIPWQRNREGEKALGMLDRWHALLVIAGLALQGCETAAPLESARRGTPRMLVPLPEPKAVKAEIPRPEPKWDPKVLDAYDAIAASGHVLFSAGTVGQVSTSSLVTLSPSTTMESLAPSGGAKVVCRDLAKSGGVGYWLILVRPEANAPDPILASVRELEVLWSPDGSMLAVNYWLSQDSRHFLVINVRNPAPKLSLDAEAVISRPLNLQRSSSRGTIKALGWTADGMLIARGMSQSLDAPYAAIVFEAGLEVRDAHLEPHLFRAYQKRDPLE